MLSMTLLTLLAVAQPPAALDDVRARYGPALSDADAWARLPRAERGGGQPLPSWARIMAAELPRSTAALLQLDFAQRAGSPLDPKLRAAMRHVAAQANGCDYARAYAEADARRAGLEDERIAGLTREGYPGWNESDRAALEFARRMTLDSDSVTDAEFATLVRHFGERGAASMVLLLAYANFQDRLLICLGAELEPEGPLPPLDVAFDRAALTTRTAPPTPRAPGDPPVQGGRDVVSDDPAWAAVTYEDLQARLEAQRRKPTRLRVPSWDEVARNLPAELAARPSDIVWYRIVFGYAPELAVPYEVYMRTAGAECAPKYDRVFAGSLFWVTTRALDCAYCMGHCEMNWEVAGLTPSEIAERSRRLAGDDWSAFPEAEQRAFAFARKLTLSPSAISDDDVAGLKRDLGDHLALIVMLNSSRYHYMTRISNGFQLTLERENVFFDYYNAKPSAPPSEPFVELPGDEEAWDRLPPRLKGGGGPMPNWAKAVSTHLPRTAAAMLELDLAQRTKSPLDPALRAKMRWMIARANRCEYSEAYALSDLRRAGADDQTVETLTGDRAGWPEEDRDPLEFARLLSVDAPSIPDELFERLRARFGDKPTAAMVLLAAYGNFQDRITLGLGLPMEAEGPLPPIDVKFDPESLASAPVMPEQASRPRPASAGGNLVEPDPEWSELTYEQLQSRLEGQRSRSPRLPIPRWEDVRANLPPAAAARPTRIVWNLVGWGYAPELAIPWTISTRTMWTEAPTDRVFEESLFWVQTRAIRCNYCMGHCEMLLEVAGLTGEEIEDRTRRLAGDDWSSFPPAEQRAFAYARKLTKAPWELTREDYARLEQDLGPKEAMATFWWLCRGLYMTRISDGFQLPLERDNVFREFAPTPPEPGPSVESPRR